MTLELARVSYRYPGYARVVLHDVDLRVERGEIVGLVGGTDAGKSTLCLVASGLAPASVGGELTGELRIDGRPAAGRRTWELASDVGLVFQDPGNQRSGATATVLEEVALGPVNLGLEPVETLARTREALDTLGIAGLALRSPGQLSGGEAQLVAIASVLAMRPAHLVLDEPTAQLDAESAGRVADALARLVGSGVSVLIAEQDTDLLGRLCDRVVVIDAGRIVRDGAAAEVLAWAGLSALGVRSLPEVRFELPVLADARR